MKLSADRLKEIVGDCLPIGLPEDVTVPGSVPYFIFLDKEPNGKAGG